MKIELTLKHLIAIGVMAMLSLLTMIGIGIWAVRFISGAAAGSNVSSADGTSVQPSPPGSAPPALEPAPVAGGDGRLLAMIRANDLNQVRATCELARQRGEYQLIRRVFFLACEHGSAGAIQAVGPGVTNPTEREEEEILGAVTKACDRTDMDAVRMAIMRMSQYGIRKERELQWVTEQFHREPWDAQRFQRISDCERWMTECFPQLAAAALNGSPERYEWLRKLVERDRVSQYTYPLRSLLVLPQTQVNEKNVDRVVELSGYVKLDVEQILIKCAPYLQPKHSGLVRNAMRYRQPPPELMNYLMKQDPAEIAAWSEQDDSLRMQVTALIDKALTQSEPVESIAELEVVIPAMKFRCQREPNWDPYAQVIITENPRTEWLWKHGIRPPTQAVQSRLFLALRFQDRTYLQEVLRAGAGSPELSTVLNNGIYRRAPDPNEHQYYVPILEAIKSWDVDAVKILLDTKAHKWQQWHNEHPLLLATKLNKKDIYDLLVSSGATWDAKSRQALATLPNVPAEVLDKAAPPTEKDSAQLHTELLIKAVKAGDLTKLDEALRRFYASTQGNRSTMGFQEILLSRQTYPTTISSMPELTNLMQLAIEHPDCFERLQFEGFRVTDTTVISIMMAENKPVLAMATRDLGLRYQLRQHAVNVLQAARDKPEMVEFYAQLGLLKNIPETSRAEVAKLYQQITGKPLNDA